MIAGLSFTWLLGRQLAKSLATRGWKAVDCTIMSGKVGERSPYTASLVFKYQINGRMLTSHTLTAGYAGSDDYYDAQKILDQYPAGSRAICRVNPADATDAVLRTPSLWSVFQILFPMIFVAIGGGGIYFIWRSPRPAFRPFSIRHPKTVQAVLFAIFFIAGLVVLGFGVPMVVRARSAQSWTRVPCLIIQSRVGSHTSHGNHGSSTTYSVDVLYRYNFAKKRHESSRYELVRSSSSGYADKEKVVDNLNRNRNQFCYVNPLDPDDAVLDRGYSAAIPLMGLIGVVSLLVGAGGFNFLIRSARKEHRTKLEEHLSPAQRGSTELHPESSPLAQFLVMCIPALIWNGLVSVFVVFIVQEWLNGSGEIFTTLFISVFVLIGIGLLVQAIGNVRTLFLPTAQLILSRHPLAMGEQVELRWQIVGHAERIQKLKIRVGIFDVSADPSGTLPLRKLIPSWSMDLIDTDKRSDIQSGRRMFSIVADGLPPVRNWKRIWAVLVEAEMEKPPRLRQVFPVHVLSGPAK